MQIKEVFKIKIRCYNNYYKQSIVSHNKKKYLK